MPRPPPLPNKPSLPCSASPLGTAHTHTRRHMIIALAGPFCCGEERCYLTVPSSIPLVIIYSVSQADLNQSCVFPSVWDLHLSLSFSCPSPPPQSHPHTHTGNSSSSPVRETHSHIKTSRSGLLIFLFFFFCSSRCHVVWLKHFKTTTTPYDILLHVHCCNFIAQGEVYPDFRHLSYQARASQNFLCYLFNALKDGLISNIYIYIYIWSRKKITFISPHRFHISKYITSSKL